MKALAVLAVVLTLSLVSYADAKCGGAGLFHRAAARRADRLDWRAHRASSRGSCGASMTTTTRTTVRGMFLMAPACANGQCNTPQKAEAIPAPKKK